MKTRNKKTVANIGIFFVVIAWATLIISGLFAITYDTYINQFNSADFALSNTKTDPVWVPAVSMCGGYAGGWTVPRTGCYYREDAKVFLNGQDQFSQLNDPRAGICVTDEYIWYSCAATSYQPEREISDTAFDTFTAVDAGDGLYFPTYENYPEDVKIEGYLNSFGSYLGLTSAGTQEPNCGNLLHGKSAKFNVEVKTSLLNTSTKQVLLNGDHHCNLYNSTGVRFFAVNSPTGSTLFSRVAQKLAFSCKIREGEVRVDETIVGPKTFDVFSLKYGSVIKANGGRFCGELPAEYIKPSGTAQTNELNALMVNGYSYTLAEGEAVKFRYIVNIEKAGLDSSHNPLQEYYDATESKWKPISITVLDNSYVNADTGISITFKLPQNCQGSVVIENGNAVCKDIPNIGQQCTELTLDVNKGTCDLYLSPESLIGSIDFEQQNCPDTSYIKEIIGLKPYRIIKCSKVLTSTQVADVKSATTITDVLVTKCPDGQIQNPSNPVECVSVPLISVSPISTGKGQQIIRTMMSNTEISGTHNAPILVSTETTRAKLLTMRNAIITIIAILLIVGLVVWRKWK